MQEGFKEAYMAVFQGVFETYGLAVNVKESSTDGRKWKLNISRLSEDDLGMKAVKMKKKYCGNCWTGSAWYALCAVLQGPISDEAEIVHCRYNSRTCRRDSSELKIPETSWYLSERNCWRKDRLADVMFILYSGQATYKTSNRGHEGGYHLLLENPISPFPEEWGELERTARETKRYVVVCHVLRYTPFYQTISS